MATMRFRTTYSTSLAQLNQGPAPSQHGNTMRVRTTFATSQAQREKVHEHLEMAKQNIRNMTEPNLIRQAEQIIRDGSPIEKVAGVLAMPSAAVAEVAEFVAGPLLAAKNLSHAGYHLAMIGVNALRAR